jgi:hypothetical protein
MSNTAITYFVAACAGVFSLTAFVGWVLIPAWSAYTRGWERAAAVFLSLYVLVSFLGAGVALGVTVIYFWDRIG